MSADDSNTNGKRYEDITNPFVAFRRFADEQMSSLMNTVFGAFHESPFKRQAAIQDYESWLKATREESATDLEPEEEKYDKYGYASVFNEDYLRYNHYSPMVLEHRESFRTFKGKWRNAFEDLMHAQYDQPLPERKDGEKVNMGSEDFSDYHSKIWGILRGHYNAIITRRLANVGPPGMTSMSNTWDSPPSLAYQTTCPRPIAEQAISKQPITEDEDEEEEEEESEPTCDFLKACELLETEEEQAQCQRYWAWKSLAMAFGAQTDEEDHDEEDHDEEDHRDHEDDEDEQTEQEQIPTELAGYLATHYPDTGKNSGEQTRKRQIMADAMRAEAEEAAAQRKDTEEPDAEISEHSSSVFSSGSSTDRDGTPSSILSTLTTTESRVLPDGSRTTRVVLKKRFSDGVEESTEQIFTQHAPIIPAPAEIVSSPAKSSASKTDKAENTKSGEKKGWFWS